MTHLRLSLGVVPDGVRVTWRLEGQAFQADEPLAELRVSIAGAPAVALDAGDVEARDDAGRLGLVGSVAEDGEGEQVRRWCATRTTVGAVEVSHLARPTAEEPRAATPPLELREEGSGYSGALKCFVALPPGPEDLTFELRWEPPAVPDPGWTAVSSLGEGTGRDHDLSGTGLERLGDTYVMCGDLAGRHHRDGGVSTWWLTPPGLDVPDFTRRLGRTYELMATTFDAPAHPYRVFLRAHPHRGANASAHPASFVMALDPSDPLPAHRLHETIAHELVHEWVGLDGPPEEVTWFVEGSADYYSLVLPVRDGTLDGEAFLRSVNLASRMAYANPRRDLTLREAQRVFFSDFLAHWLPYTRGMFYLADLDARVRAASGGRRSVDDLVRDVVRRRGAGERVGVEQWSDLVDEHLAGEESRVLEALVFTGSGRPGSGCFGSGFERRAVEVPVLDLGFDPATFVTRRVQGVVPGGPADRAGLEDGEVVDLPSYPEAQALDVGDTLTLRVTRGGEKVVVDLPLHGRTAIVPQWHRPG